MNINNRVDKHHTFFVLDFDRTLADSDKLLRAFIEVVNQYIDLPLEQVEKMNADVRRKGDSFDTATYVRDRLLAHHTKEDWDRLEKQFIQESRPLDMLMPGAAELLDFLEENQLPYGVLTYGNPLWQRLKLAASKFNHVRRIVTTNKYKGELIASWQQENGAFILPGEFASAHAQRIVLIDDKAQSFRGFPEQNAIGYQVVDYAQLLPAQSGALPRNVTHLPSLSELIPILAKEHSA